MLIVILITVFVTVGFIAWTLFYLIFRPKSVVEQRLAKLAPAAPTFINGTNREPWLDGTLKKLGSAIPVSPKNQSKYAKMLIAAGYRAEHVYVFIGSKLVCACLLPLLYPAYLVFTKLSGGSFKEALFQSQHILLTLTLAIVGFLLPSYWLYFVMKKRQTTIFHSLPDIHDLLTVCVEAGLSLDAGLIRVTETPQFDKDPLANEIRIATRETRAGKPRIDALKDMAERTQVEDVKSFVIMLGQTEKFGTSLGQALRVHADSLRTKRRQLAEEAAAKTTIKLIFPLAFFIFPALLVVMLGSACIAIFKMLE
jgi:tight adherence protein C